MAVDCGPPAGPAAASSTPTVREVARRIGGHGGRDPRVSRSLCGGAHVRRPGQRTAIGLLDDRGRIEPDEEPDKSPTRARKSPTKSPTTNIYGSARGVGPFSDTRPLDPHKALVELIAAAASAQPPTVAPGQVLYQHFTGWVVGQEARTGQVVVQTANGPVIVQDREMWSEPEGMIMARSMMDGTDEATMPKNDQASALAGARLRFAQQGPSLGQPTPQWLHTLPTTGARFRELLTPPSATSSKWTGEHDIWHAAADLLSAIDLFLPIPQRIGLYQMLAQLPNLTAAQVETDGHRLIAIRYSEAEPHNEAATATSELLFDPTTGRAVGTGSLSTATATGLPR